jgi:hypothetical protein
MEAPIRGGQHNRLHPGIRSALEHPGGWASAMEWRRREFLPAVLCRVWACELPPGVQTLVHTNVVENQTTGPMPMSPGWVAGGKGGAPCELPDPSNLRQTRYPSRSTGTSTRGPDSESAVPCLAI